MADPNNTPKPDTKDVDQADINAKVNSDVGNVIPFDFSSPVKDIRKDKYNSDKLWEPESDAAKNKCFKIYQEYIMTDKTYKQLSDEFDYTLTHISRMVKWVTFQIGDIDANTEVKATIDSLKLRKQKMQKVLDTTQIVNEKSKIWNSMLKVDKVIAQLQGSMSSASVQINDNRKQTNVLMNDEFQRRTNEEVKKIEEPVREEKIIEADGVVVNGDLNRRTGS